MSSRNIWIMVNPTLNCNKTCEFCYNRGVRKPNIELTSKSIEIIVYRYNNHVVKYGDSLHNMFCFFGGEPLLKKDIIIELVDKIRSISPKVFCDVFTNGILLDEEFVRWTKEKRVTIGLSANDSSIDFLIEKMKLISQYRRYARLSIVLTKYNLLRLESLLDLAANFGFQVRLRHLYNGGTDKEYLEMYDSIVPNAIRYVIEKDYQFYPYVFFEMTNPFWNKSFWTHVCGRKYFVIDPNLDVRICLAQDTKIGNLEDENFDFVEAMEKSNHDRFDYQGIEECEQCEFNWLCGSGCPLTKKLAFNKTSVPSPFCKTWKKVFPLLIEMKNKWIALGKNVRY